MRKRLFEIQLLSEKFFNFFVEKYQLWKIEQIINFYIIFLDFPFYPIAILSQNFLRVPSLFF